MPRTINDVGSGWAAIEVNIRVNVMVAVASETTRSEPTATALVVSADAINAKAEIPKSTRVSFIEPTISSLT
jgi:hypothetical protein